MHKPTEELRLQPGQQRGFILPPQTFGLWKIEILTELIKFTSLDTTPSVKKSSDTSISGIN